jgi:hypothetical protein
MVEKGWPPPAGNLCRNPEKKLKRYLEGRRRTLPVKNKKESIFWRQYLPDSNIP